MKSWIKAILLCGCLILPSAAAACSNNSPANGANSSTPPQPASASQTPNSFPSETDSADKAEKEYKLVWSDEFDGPNGSPADKDKWVMEIGNNNGWGNNELQYYTDSTKNCFIQDGNLVIRAVKEDKEGFLYTSARIKTLGKFEFQYGKIEMCAKLPYGKGIWPAFWMLGADFGSVKWPDCGEIDIMEFIGRQPNKIYGTLHGPEYSGSMGLGSNITSKEDLHDTYHIYSLEWDEDSLKWYFDGELYHKIFREKLPSSYTWVYDKKFFILLNLAVGGNWPQNPDSSTMFPQSYVIDYVRVYQ